jgi:hypothetical protein
MRGEVRTAERRGTKRRASNRPEAGATREAEATRSGRKIRREKVLGAAPNPALQRIAALLWFRMDLKGNIWAARAEGCR